MRDKRHLEELYQSKRAPWMLWEKLPTQNHSLEKGYITPKHNKKKKALYKEDI